MILRRNGLSNGSFEKLLLLRQKQSCLNLLNITVPMFERCCLKKILCYCEILYMYFVKYFVKYNLSICCMWLGSVVVKASDLQSRSQVWLLGLPLCWQLMTIGKFFTHIHVPLSPTVGIVGTGQRAVMLCGWESNCRPGRKKVAYSRVKDYVTCADCIVSLSPLLLSPLSPYTLKIQQSHQHPNKFYCT